MKTTTLALLVLLFASFAAANAYALTFHNHSDGTLCIAVTRDEPEPFDENVARITEGWDCVENLATLEIERTDGVVDIAVRRSDGSDYVASSCLALEKTIVYVPKDVAIEVFGVEILRHARGWVAYSMRVGADGAWSSYRTVPNGSALPAAMDAIGWKPVEAWRIDGQQGDLGYVLE